MSTTANCPSCGASVLFAIGSSAVVVCGYCRSVVARTDRGLETFGKVADLIDTGSPLQVGATGRYRGQGFRITGRTQLRHQAGGVWDEWYASFDDGRWGWLAEAQGRFYVTFKTGGAAPRYEQLVPGAAVPGFEPLVVAELGSATVVSAEGELPWRPLPGESYRYADLTGEEQRFATIDYSEEPPVVFQGTEAAFRDLGIEGQPERSTRVAAAALNCSQCGGALDLKAPDRAERVWCPYCGAGHDITQGKLQFFAMLGKKRFPRPIENGSKGTIEGDEYVVAGFMRRSVTFDQTYYWTEYLLWNREKGYRWLVHSDDHWSFVTPLRPGEVRDSGVHDVAKYVRYHGRRYRLFQTATAKVRYVDGEFYWRVDRGEQVDTADYVAPPYGISKETTTAGAQEVAYSHARYMQPGEVEKAFGLKNLTRPRMPGPMQPYPGPRLGKPWALMLLALFAVAIVLGVTRPSRVVYSKFIDLTATAPAAGDPANARVLFSEPFELSGDYNLRVQGSAAVNNSWVYVAGDLFHEASGTLQQFELPLEYYSGVENGERWSEGDHTKDVHLSKPEKGTHVLRLETQWEQGKTPPQLQIEVREGVFRWLHFLLALVAISVFPVFALIGQYGFESKRWQDSAYNPYATSQDDDDEE